MKKVILRDHRRISPFNEEARDLRILNKPLWLYQRDVLARHCSEEITIEDLVQLPHVDEMLVYRDSQFFNPPLMDEFVTRAKALGKACQVAFRPDDRAVVEHVLPLQDNIIKDDQDLYRGELWYYPHGWVPDEDVTPLVIDTEPLEIGWYHVPTYLVQTGDLVFQVPLKAFIPIESWVHVMLANSLFGAFGWARRLLKEANSVGVKLNILARSLIERKHFMSCSALVRVGRNCKIDPTAIIQGPTIIGNNVEIQAGAMILSSVIGDNVTIMPGAQMVASVVSNGCYIPFRAALFGTSFMENTMVAQNTILQGCVVGRNTFIGGGNTFTDYNLMGKQIKTMHNGKLEWVGMAACGSAVGHDCRIGAGFVIYPGRTIESGTILVYKGDQAVIDYNIDAESAAHDDRVIRMYDSPFVTEDITPPTARPDGPGGGSGPSSHSGIGLDWGDMTAPADRSRIARPVVPDERSATAAWAPLQGPAASKLSEA
jgi:carbonic anhydrase/acetyltransferase-like protein (isoleucine patch superfamily)